MQLEEYLNDNDLCSTEDRSHVLDFVADNYVPKDQVDAVVKEQVDVSIEAICTTLSRLSYRRTGSTLEAESMIRELKETLAPKEMAGEENL